MKNFLLIVLFLSILLLPANGYSKTDPIVKKIIKIGKKDNRTMQHLDVLCNRFGGRPIGSAAYDNAAEWAGNKFKEWGMKVIYEEAGTLPFGFNRGHWSGKMTSPKNMNLHFATPSYTAGTRGKQVAHAVLEPKNEKEFNRMKKKIKGAWVLIHFPKKDKSKEKKLDYWARREKAEEDRKKMQVRLVKLEKAGALGAIFPAKLPIQATYDKELFNWKSWKDLPNLCHIRLNEHQFAEIKQMLIERQRVELELDIRNYFKMGPVKYHNVIGLIQGTKYPNEYVIFGGHLDSYDVASGAVDNGNGTTTSMEAARLIMAAGGKPKRTILVCLWAGEEFGLLGSQHWVKKNKDKLPKISAMFNRDGGPTVPKTLSVSEAMWKDMEEICKPVNGINKDFTFKLTKRKPRKKPKKIGGSDHVPFAMKGVPTMGFRNGDPKGYDFKYREIWHTENDYFQKSIAEYQNHASIVTAVVVYGIANLDHLLSREGFYLPEEKKEKKDKKKRN